ncbi:peptidase T [Caproiciproducens sp. NJN-50]|uniref:peptidase T n=1 Tax=Acutalibacteraceae TaxID=3082771 RepID=UPI000FFE22CD|nr:MULTISPECIES: peptidase T [Acutalibacteraceae]QAT50602.1 peptidase T [Caproiciproducens sp. NJN-50]
MKAYERLLHYASFDTTSCEDSESCPSTPGQLRFADALAEEMKSLGFSGVRRDESGYVYGTLPASCEAKAPVIGLISHMDTSDAAPGAGIRPRIVRNYDGGDIVLNREKNIVMRAADYRNLADCIGEDLIVTDGTTLLGADDKAGIAEILTMAEELNRRGTPHGTIAVAFTPDEEIGRGADRFDVKGFGADFAYTVDGGTVGELEYENFNAAGAVVTVHGVSVHPGDAKNRLRSAAQFAMEFHSMLPEAETPEHTEGREGFYHLTRIAGDAEHAELRYIIRDHDRAKFEARKETVRKIADYLNEKYGAGTFELSLSDSYYNMKEKIEEHPEIVARAEQAMREAGMEPRAVPIRGGTDGARLSFMGLPCPNLPTGGQNFHGRFEFIPIRSMEQMAEVLINLVKAGGRES